MPETSEPIKVSFSFYPADMKALDDRVRALQPIDPVVRAGTVLRALIHLTAPAEMIAETLQLFGAYAQKTGPREDETVTGHPTVDLSKDQIRKIDGVIDQLARRGLTTTRSFVMRAILRAAPEGKALAPVMKKFLMDFPPRVSGWAARNAKLSRG